MHLPPREFDKLLIYMVAEVALKRREQGLKLNRSKAVAVISAAELGRGPALIGSDECVPAPAQSRGRVCQSGRCGRTESMPPSIVVARRERGGHAAQRSCDLLRAGLGHRQFCRSFPMIGAYAESGGGMS